MNHGTISKEIARGLKVLQHRITLAGIPPSKLDASINIATWNIREFGTKPRQEASLHFIAEIIGQFDVVSVVEVSDDVTDLSKVLGYLGPYWKVVFSDYLRDPGGNQERIAFVYDSRAATFAGLASQAIAGRTKTGTEYASQDQLVAATLCRFVPSRQLRFRAYRGTHPLGQGRERSNPRIAGARGLGCREAQGAIRLRPRHHRRRRFQHSRHRQPAFFGPSRVADSKFRPSSWASTDPISLRKRGTTRSCTIPSSPRVSRDRAASWTITRATTRHFIKARG